jgi:hypothetical protein
VSERDIREDQVRAEHLAEVDQVHQWAYLLAVTGSGTVLMLALIAMLGSSA